MSIRYQYTIWKPNPEEDGDPYLLDNIVYSLDEARELCPVGSDKYCSVTEQEKHIESDDDGQYVHWESLRWGSLEEEELHGDKPITDYLLRY